VHKAALRAERASFDEDERVSRGVVRALWRRLAPRRSHDTVLGILALGALGAIFINALFLQPGPHPAPIFALRPAPPAPPAPRPAVSAHEATGAIAVLPRPRPPELQARSEAARSRDVLSDVQRELATRSPAKAKPNAASAPVVPATLSAAAPRSEPAAGLVVPARQVVAVQQALGDFGYGQVKPTGVYDPETRAAIEAFEGARRLPVTGQITDRLMRELAAMTGRSLN
jgi:hypothetical protein